MIYKNLIYIHIPKTGGSSIRNSLNKNYKLIYNSNFENFEKMGFKNYSEKFENYNFPIFSFKDHLPYQLIKRADYHKDKFKFTITRNPFSRIVSLYFECIANKLHLEGLKIKKTILFDDFVDIICKKSYWFTIPMTDYIGSKNLNDIDFIGRFENFDDDLIKLRKYLKISIKHHNYNNSVKSIFKFSDYRTYFKNKENIDKVYKLYKDDFDNFNYDYKKFLSFERKKINLINILLKITKRKLNNLFN